MANSTLSKVIAKDSGAGVSPLGPNAAAAPPLEGVREFEPRRLQVNRAAPPGKPAARPTPLYHNPDAQDGVDTDALQREAFQQGHQEGERSGAERAAAQYREAVAGFGHSALQVATLKPRLRAEAERELVDLAFAIARRILRRELTVDPTAVVGLIRGCLEQYSRAEITRLQVHPQDFDAVTKFFQENPAPGLELVAEPKVTRGGVIFETSRGTLDARFETQLEEIQKGLTDR